MENYKDLKALWVATYGKRKPNHEWLNADLYACPSKKEPYFRLAVDWEYYCDKGRALKENPPPKVIFSVKIKSKFSQCRQCKYDNICEGVWKEYPEKRGNKEFVSVK